MAKTTHIIDWTTTNASVSIEAYSLPSAAVPLNDPYASLIVYHGGYPIKITVDVGAITLRETVTATKRESISFSGLESSASQRIVNLVYIEGLFFNEDGSEITPSFTVKNGKVIASVECWGTGFIEYLTQGDVYDYVAEQNGFSLTYGTVFVFMKNKKGIAASYQIPSVEDSNNGNREDILTVYREVIVQGSHSFERPENWATDNSYANYPDALEAEKPTVGEDYSVTQWYKEVVFVERGLLFTDRPATIWYSPTAGDAFQGVVWKISSNIPAAPTETINADLITDLIAMEAALKLKYEIT